MRIYHYTKAATLPLILRNKTIRFTRADCLDDTYEVPFTNAYIDPKNFFISSWTLQGLEQSGQWHRYGDQSAGVRISFEGSPFRWSNLSIDVSRAFSASSPPKRVGLRFDDIEAPYDHDAIFGNGYLLVPDTAYLRREFGDRVMYVNDPIQEASRFLKVEDETTTTYGRGSNLARIKGVAWADQEEYRYVLFAKNGPQLDYSASPNAYTEAMLDMLEAEYFGDGIKLSPQPTFIDLPLDEMAFGSLTVTIGTKISDENRELVLSALRQFAPAAISEPSTLTVR